MKLTSLNRLVSDMVFASKRDKKMILLPIGILLLALTLVFVFLTMTGPLAPFIYPLF